MATSFWLALQFLTRLPTPRLAKVEARQQRAVFYFFPVAGLLIGGLLLLVYAVLPSGLETLTAALLVTFWVFISGGLHIDGLADAADAWLGGQGDRARSLAIMKDPNVGAGGVMAVACLLLIKVAALSHLLHMAAGPVAWALVAVPVIGRCVPALLFFSAPYARAQGLASPLIADANQVAQRLWAGVCLLLTAAPLSLLLGAASAWLWLVLALQWFLLRRLMLTRLGGVTGDTVGAAIELTEMWALVMLAYLCAT